MASILPFFFFFLLPLFSSSSPPPTSLIEKTCNATTYYSFCVSSLSSSSSLTPPSTVQSLSTTLINLAIANATSASSYASSLAASATLPLSSLLRTCADKYSRAGEALQAAQDSMSREEYDYAFVSISAAEEYPNVCRVLFRPRQGAKKVAAYPAEMAKREEVLERLCTVALQIISLLVDGGGANNLNN